MAQTGYTPILIYSSSTGGNAPAAGNLTNSTLGSELAINIADGKLFYKDNANVVQVIGWKTTPTTAGGTGLTSYTAGDLTYYASGTTLTKLSIGAANTVLTSSGTAPQWSSSLTVTGLTNSGNLTFTGTGNRITGDFSNTTQASRVAFQTSTVNGNTAVTSLPNGTGTQGAFNAFNNPDPTNAAFCQIRCNNTEASLISGITGTGTFLPMTFLTGGAERMRIFTSGGVSIGNTTDPGAKNLSVSGSINIDPGTANSTTYNQIILKGGAASGNGIGYMKRQTTPSVANSATDILGVGSFGALVIVTGVGSGAIFSDLLMVSYNGVAVVSSNTQQGSPAARTYTTASGFLRLAMGSATAMAITAQSLETGGTGA